MKRERQDVNGMFKGRMFSYCVDRSVGQLPEPKTSVMLSQYGNCRDKCRFQMRREELDDRRFGDDTHVRASVEVW